MGYWWLRPLQLTIKGAGITLGSTVISCGLAIQVEKNTNRLFFHMAPHWYANVDYAYGITEEQLASVRHLRRQQQETLVPLMQQSSTANIESSEAAFSPETQVALRHQDRSCFDASSPKTVVVIPLGDVMSHALTA